MGVSLQASSYIARAATEDESVIDLTRALAYCFAPSGRASSNAALALARFANCSAADDPGACVSTDLWRASGASDGVAYMWAAADAGAGGSAVGLDSDGGSGGRAGTRRSR